MAQYIDKSALIAEIENIRKHYIEKDFDNGWNFALYKILYFIDTLEVKEVDLEKEIKEEYLKHRCYGGRDNMLVILNEPQFNEIAKHFFELALSLKNK